MLAVGEKVPASERRFVDHLALLQRRLSRLKARVAPGGRLRCFINALRPLLAFAGIPCLSPRCLDTLSPFVWRAYLHGIQIMAPATLSQWIPNAVNLRSTSSSGNDFHSCDCTIFAVDMPAIPTRVFATRYCRIYQTTTAVCSTLSTRRFEERDTFQDGNTRAVRTRPKPVLIFQNPSRSQASSPAYTGH